MSESFWEKDAGAWRVFFKGHNGAPRRSQALTMKAIVFTLK
jgi:hypothetical protein